VASNSDPGVVVEDISPDQAEAALTRANESSRRVRSRAPTTRVFCAVNAAGWGASVLAFGLIKPIPVRLPVWFALLALPLAGVVVWYRRQPATALPTPAPRRGWWVYLGPMLVVYTVVASVGEAANLYGQLAYWGPAAVAVATPLSLLALRARRP
jgi:hypothetical protein